MATPAQRYAGARRRQARDGSPMATFVPLYPFGLDPFQVRACAALEAGRGVLVAAPTGAGKTVVGEFAVHLALAEGRKCFYTTPIKALSNQKYADLVARYGADQVGLLTGDNSVNGEAPVVVMTTEVLRNMLYAGSSTLSGLGYVVMDEVHYLSDRFRGAVWEEVIIHLPESVRARLAVGDGQQRRGVRRLARHGARRHRGHRRGAPPGPAVAARDGQPPAVRPVRRRRQAESRRSERGAHGGEGQPRAGPDGARAGALRADGYQQRPGRGGRRPRSVGMPSRVEVLERLDAEGLLPAITFIFSRAGCDAAVAQCLHAGLRLLTPDEAHEVREFVDTRCADIPRRGPAACSATTSGSTALERGHRRAPRRDAADVQGGRRAAVRPRPRQGRLRHRDPGAGHQHAGPVRGPRAAGEVERRDPRRRHAGGVHPADRAGGAARHRRRGPCRRRVAAGPGAVGAGRPRLDPHLSAAVELPPVVQHGRQPGRPVRPGPGPRAAGVVVRAVPGRPRGRRPGPPGRAATRRGWTATRRR